MASTRLRFSAIALSASLLFTLLPGLAAPARAIDLPPLRSTEPPFFSADVAIALDSDGRSSLAVTITVPYQELNWLKLPHGYGAAVEFSVAVQPAKASRQYGDAWERRVVVASYTATRSSANNLVVTRTFPVPADRYAIRIGVRDVNSDVRAEAKDNLTVADYTKVPVGFADLELGLVDSTGAFTPVPTRRFGTNVNRLAARATLFDRRTNTWPHGYTFRYHLLDELGQSIADGETQVQLKRSAEPVLVRPTRSDLFLGSYTFEVELVEGKSRWKVTRSFEVEESGPPHGKEYERLLEPLSYIADSREIDRLRTASPEQQAQAWEEFWRPRDPTPETARNEAMVEFFQRMRYAEQHFSGFGPGWRSDMGRIYVKYGPPDQIENRPASSVSPQQEIWYYNQPYRRFVFRDRDGFGRYELVNPGAE